MSVYKPHGGHECGGHDHGDEDEDDGHGHSHGHDHGDKKVEGEGEGHSHGHDHGHSHGGHDHGHSHGGGENINIRAAVVHVIGDMLQSIGVIIAAILITFFPGAKIADPICTYLFSVLVLITTIPVFRDCMRILMEVQPPSVDAHAIRAKILKIPEVDTVDDIHTWALAGSKNIMTVHVTLITGDGGE